MKLFNKATLGNMLKPKKGRAFFVYAAVALVVFAGSIVVIKKFAIKQNSAAASNCTTGWIAEKIVDDPQVIELSNAEGLKIANSVKELKNYQSSPNCLYILTRYSIATADLTAARLYLERLKIIAEADIQAVPTLQGSMSIEQLEQQIASLDEVLKSSSTNIQFFGTYDDPAVAQ